MQNQQSIQVEGMRAVSKKDAVHPLCTEYRHLLSASVLAHARYLAAIGEKRFTEHHVLQRKADWQSLEARRTRMKARLTHELRLQQLPIGNSQ